MKPTMQFGNCRCVELLALRCDGGDDHTGWSWTSAACSYWRGSADAVDQTVIN